MTGAEGRNKPVLVVVAGANGSGKTTLTQQLLQDRWLRGVTYLNPDTIAQERFGGWNDPKAVLQAAQYVSQTRETALASRTSIASICSTTRWTSRRRGASCARPTVCCCASTKPRRTKWPSCCAALCGNAPDQPGFTATTPTQSYLTRRAAPAVFSSNCQARADELRCAGPAPPRWSKMRCSMAM